MEEWQKEGIQKRIKEYRQRRLELKKLLSSYKTKFLDSMVRDSLREIDDLGCIKLQLSALEGAIMVLETDPENLMLRTCAEQRVASLDGIIKDYKDHKTMDYDFDGIKKFDDIKHDEKMQDIWAECRARSKRGATKQQIHKVMKSALAKHYPDVEYVKTLKSPLGAVVIRNGIKVLLKEYTFLSYGTTIEVSLYS